MKKSITKPYIIGISGGSASGKTSVSKEIFDRMGFDDCLMITMDSYYRIISKEEREDLANFNFDHPTSFDYDLLNEQLTNLLNNKTVEMPVYNFTISAREEYTQTIKPSYLIVFEGIFALYDRRIRDLMDMKIFVDTDDDVRLARRIYRDVKDRGRTIRNVLERYNKFVKPAFEEYIRPTRRYADIIIPQGSENKVAIDFVCINLKHQLEIRQNVMNNKIKSQIEFNLHDLFDTKTINSDRISTINDDNRQELLKNILEDFLNHDRKLYLKFFAETLVNNALEKVSESLEGKKINLIDELLSAEEISKMNFVENIILFETVLLSDEDLEKCIHKLNLLAGKEVKFLNVVLIYSSPEIMVSLISQCEKLSLDVAVSVIYSTNMLHNFREVLIKGGEVDSPYDQDVMKPDKIAQLFRKILTSNWDIVEQK